MGGQTIRDTLRESRLYSTRLWAAAAAAGLLCLVLFGRLAYLQVIAHRHYATLSQANHIKPMPIAPVRGFIYDRHGVVLAQNVPVLTLEITPDQVNDLDATLAALAEVVTLGERDLKNFERARRNRPRYEAIALRTHLSDEEAARFAVHRHRFHGVELRAQLQRHYPQGALAVHAVGYVGRISEADLETIHRASYFGSQYIGKVGVEQSYEDLLFGRAGAEKIEVNAHGRALRTLERVPPRAGRSLYLTLDSRLQRLAEQALGRYKGAVVALEPKSGEILAFAGTPTYDPNWFVNGIDPERYRQLRDSRDKPLLNRPLNGRYPPASTIKAFLALAALEADIPLDRPTLCPGWFSLPGDSHRFRCWKKDGHGAVNLHDAVVQSCDVYFYDLAVRLGIERLERALAGFGFGARTGIDLKGESEGLLPSPARKRLRDQRWYPGETVVTGIGQGPMLATPLQLAAATAAIANRGLRVQPRLAHAFLQPQTRELQLVESPALEPLPVSDGAHMDVVIGGLTDVVHGPNGTARGIGWNAPYRIAGKTGTAQLKGIGQEGYHEQATPEHLRDHALFIAFAPADDPQIAVAVVVENAGPGGAVAAPIARKLLDYHLLGKDRPVMQVPAAQVDE
jgi:penicillin-binding protein 2